MAIEAVIWDFGGVITTSPFEAFSRYEREHGLPDGFLRQVNATDPDRNAWARLERNEVGIDGFAELFEAESRAAGHAVDGRVLLGLLAGDARPEMVTAVRRCAAELSTALVTNNFVPAAETGPAEDVPTDAPPVGAAASAPGGRAGTMGEVLDAFDVVVESSRVGVRKPDPAIYEMVCGRLGIAPEQAVFLDDLGVNLKPAREMGMTTIKVVDPDQALDELEAVVEFPVR